MEEAVTREKDTQNQAKQCPKQYHKQAKNNAINKQNDAKQVLGSSVDRTHPGHTGPGLNKQATLTPTFLPSLYDID